MIKRLHRFVIETFLPIFAMTFMISLFILLMQLLWRFVGDLVGKGITFDILTEFFFWAAASLIPMALPLAILIASLMTFGNLGERLELLAIKAAGISLIRVMRPLIILVGLISIGSFFYQNKVVPIAQVNMWTLLFSMRQKAPELDIPEGAFYHKIPGYNLFIQKKNPKTGVLYDVMIYNFSEGFENASILVADSGTLNMTADKKYLYLTLFNGEGFENLRRQQTNSPNVPYRREEFTYKQILVDFNSDFSRMDNSFLMDQWVAKDLGELRAGADSISNKMDSVRRVDHQMLTHSQPLAKPFIVAQLRENKPTKTDVRRRANWIDSTANRSQILPRAPEVTQKMREYMNPVRQDIEFRAMSVGHMETMNARYRLEYHRKLAYAAACIIFLLIGAPLGAIIRKGGIGWPAVISVLLFIVYYIIDYTGYKMAKDIETEAWFGMWLSAIILLPLGIFITHRASRDVGLINTDNYIRLFRQIILRKKSRKLGATQLMYHESTTELAQEMQAIDKQIQEQIKQICHFPSYRQFWQNENIYSILNEIGERTDRLVEHLQALNNRQIILKLTDYPQPAVERFGLIPRDLAVRRSFMWVIPIGISLYLYIRFHNKQLIDDLRAIVRVNQEIRNLFN